MRLVQFHASKLLPLFDIMVIHRTAATSTCSEVRAVNKTAIATTQKQLCKLHIQDTVADIRRRGIFRSQSAGEQHLSWSLTAAAMLIISQMANAGLLFLKREVIPFSIGMFWALNLTLRRAERL